jgi:hypothetical protein
VPETYTLNIPQADVEFADDKDLERIAVIAKANQWSNEDAQAELAAQIDLRRTAHTQLYAEAQAHPEIGGDKLEAAGQRAKAFMDKLLPATEPDGARLRRDLQRLGLSNYPPLVVLLARAGAAMAEDSPVAGSTATNTGPKATEDVLWPDKK